MLEVKNLHKVYKTKKKVQVEALKGVSIKFPERGMVFLLGKSGSGKSTLLNLLGGLDKYDDGDILIKGVSSKQFSQGQFDSYRNTYVGFIFQEYNVLEDFSVGMNIALAIELQGRKATNEEINQILQQVDLEGFGDRKPNELSGGQKQRVAIARALVKKPEIIMADEPTGALDSNTGRQVFDTLKKLSEDKLVIVVSHDREFAEFYGDRIIELADGEVINDVERVSQYKPSEQNTSDNVMVEYEIDRQEGIVFDDDTMIIPQGYFLTEEDRVIINNYIKSMNSDLKGVISKKSKSHFSKTDESKIVATHGGFELIKSKLPLKNAFKMGASGLKHKKIRLVITILLSFVAFSLFGLADTMGNYDHVKTCTKSIKDSNIQYAAMAKQEKGEDQGYWSENKRMKESEIDKLRKDTGMDFIGVYQPLYDMSLPNYYAGEELSDNDEYSAYSTYLSGFAEITQKHLDEMGYEILEGRLPQGDKNEVAISEYLFKTYQKAGYVEGVEESDKAVEIHDYKDLIGKKLQIGQRTFEVVGIIDTKVDEKRYSRLSEYMEGLSTSERLINYALANELRGIWDYSLSCAAMVGQGQVQKMIDEDPQYIESDDFLIWIYNEDYQMDAYKVTKLSQIDTSKITWLDGEKKKLSDNEIIVDMKSLSEYGIASNLGELELNLKNNNSFTMEYYDYMSEYDDVQQGTNWKIVGVIENQNDSVGSEDNLFVLPDGFFVEHWGNENGSYEYAVASMPKDTEDIEELVKYSYNKKEDIRYSLQNSVTYELDAINEVFVVLSKVFFYIGIGFAVFAALMLSNFIATSISYKKQEIGILRAIGARSNDVFRIFFSESFIIAMVNFVLSCIGTGVATWLISKVIRMESGLLITVLSFGIRQFILLFVLSIVVAAVASFIPVYKIASKKPVDAIRNK